MLLAAVLSSSRARSVPFLFGSATVFSSALVLVGWWSDSHGLRSVVPGLESMKPLTAVSLGLLGIAVALGRGVPRVPPLAAVLSAAAAGTIGLIAIGEYLGLVAVGVDTVLFRGSVQAESALHPGRMAPVTAVCIVAAAGAVLLLRLRWFGVATLLSAVVLLLSGLAMTGYLYGVTSLHGAGPYATMALNTAVSLNVLALGLMWSTPNRGLLGLARNSEACALLIQRAVPAVVVLSLGFGWLDLQAMHAGWYQAEFALAVMAIAAGTIAGLVLWRAALSIALLDRSRKDAMDALADSNRRLEEDVRERTAASESQAAIQHACLEALEQGVVLSTLDAEVLLLNRAGRELLGHEAEELTELYRSGRWISYQENGEVLPIEERPVRTTMDTGEPVVGKVLVWRLRDGVPVTMRVSTQPVFDSAGQLTGLVTAITDVTAERVAEREAALHLSQITNLSRRLQEAVQMKDRFLSIATHDMRAPIATIIGFADLLTHDELTVPPENRAGYLKAIKRQGLRLEALVQDLLSIAVLDGGDISFDPLWIDLVAAARQIVADTGGEDQIEVRASGTVECFTDPLRLAQMVTNLLHNAMRYGRAPIVLSIDGDPTSVTVRVSDCGDGVDPAFVPDLFERFTADRRRSGPDSTGTGLGLAIVRGLARLHGGDVSYEPNEPSGACFVITLPTRGQVDGDSQQTRDLSTPKTRCSGWWT